MISLLITHKHMELPLQAEGQLDLPKQPPFEVLTPGWAVKVTAQFGAGDPNVIRIFDAWYEQGWELDVRAGDGRGFWVRAWMQCVSMDRQVGLQITRAWDGPPLRREGGLPYRPTPRFQRITRPAWTYELAAMRWATAAVPHVFKKGLRMMEAVN